MRVLGLRTYRDHVRWASVDGADRASATLAAYDTLQPPAGERGASLAWIRRQIAVLVEQEQPDAAVLSPAEGSNATNALTERAQMDGVVLEALHVLGIPTKTKKSTTLRHNFGASTVAELAKTLGRIPLIAAIPPTSARRDPAVAAVSELPA